MDWMVAWGPQLALSGALVAVLGAIVAAVGAWGTTHRQNREQLAYSQKIARLAETVAEKSDESAAKSERITELTQQALAAITGGNSFCGAYASLKDDALGFRVRHFGEFPLYDVEMYVKETQGPGNLTTEEAFHRAFDATDVMSSRIGTIAADTAVAIRKLIPLPTDERKEFDIIFFGRNGIWWQRISLQRVDGQWQTTFVIRRRDSKAFTELHREDNTPVNPR
jgi:hypothetical protein